MPKGYRGASSVAMIPFLRDPEREPRGSGQFQLELQLQFCRRPRRGRRRLI